MRGISQVSSAVKSISGGGKSCRKGYEVRSIWTCSGNWKKMRLEQRERGGNVVAVFTRGKRETHSQVSSDTLKTITEVYLQSIESHYRVLKQKHGCSDLWFVFSKGHMGGYETCQSVTRVETR